jgi:hypothetical protein
MISLNRPSTEEFVSVQNYMDKHKPLMEAEASWANHEEDIITLRGGREHAWLDSSIEKLLKWFHCKTLEVSTSNPSLYQSSSQIFILERVTDSN